MRYIGKDNDSIYLKCRRCNKIFFYNKTNFNIRENSKCPICKKGHKFIWFYPIKFSKTLLTPPVLIMTLLSATVIFIICFPLFQRFYLFNKAITALSPLLTSILISALCSFLSIAKDLKSEEQDNNKKNKNRSNLIVIVFECIILIFTINIIMQTQYCPLEITNPNTGDIQQYFGNTTGEFASGKGRLFDSQGHLVYLGGFKNNLYNDYGIQYELIDTVHNIGSTQSYKCIYEGFYKDGVPNGEGREYRYDAEYTFEKSKDVNPNLYYKGTFKDGKYCGYGTLYDLESKYEGVFFNGIYNGYGNQWFMHSSKKVYKIEGNFQDGLLNGAGKMYYPDGNIYLDGIYEHGKVTSGTSYRTDGSIRYTGEWNENSYHGKGTLYWPNGQIQFDGDWINDMRSGSGTSFREDGTMEYIGSWEDDKYFGYGTLYYENGTTVQYDGRYNYGLRSGNGDQFYRNGKPQYSGSWKDDIWNGPGKWFWENGKVYYEGSFENGKPSGFGSFYSDNGMINYEGECENNFRSGYGTSYNDDGIKDYQGNFLENMRDGYGISFWPNGNIQYEGNWQSNYYSGEGSEYDMEGNLLHKGIFDNGEFISSSDT